jgi:asparagine synthase (glutamine-hydrolysing)
MSAIAGIFNLDHQPVNLSDLQRMNACLKHRGLDGEGTWSAGEMGLAQQLLWTTPESLNEHLPKLNQRGNQAICSDARLDNREELISALRMDDRHPSEITDSELILAAYEKWGENCPEKLLGDFVFAICDLQNRSLFCARDPLGIKHFYYYFNSKKLFALASEIKALLSLPDVPQKLNELAVADHLLPVYGDKVQTFYKNIFRLPSGHCLTITPQAMKLRKYYWPDLSYELRLRSNEEYAEAFREVFTRAVHSRLRSAFPVASMLSGGLDSSSITCVAGNLLAKEGRSPLLTFSGIWPSMAELDPKSDERRYMKSVASRGGFASHYVHADRLSPLTDWKKMLWHIDGALSAPNMYLDWAIFKAANQRGARVLLGGTDGDTTVSYGYEDLTEFARRGRWIKLVKEARALGTQMPRRGHRFKKLMWDEAFKPLVPEFAWRFWRRLRGRSGVSDQRPAGREYWRKRPINPDFSDRLNIRERFWHLQNNSYPSKITAREEHWHSINHGQWSYILETFEKGAAAFSVETRYPFFDRRLIEFCLALPPGQKLHNGWTRSILRRAMTGILPPEIQWRPDKGSLSSGVSLNLLKHERETMDDSLIRKVKMIRDYVELPSLGALYEKYQANPLANVDHPFTLMLIVNLSLWLQVSGLRSA